MATQVETKMSFRDTCRDRQFRRFSLYEAAAIATGIFIQQVWHETGIGLGVMTLLIALAASVMIVPKAKRNVWRLAVFPVLLGVLMWAIAQATGFQTFE